MALPGSKTTFTTHSAGQTITAAHINQIQTSVSAVEDNLGTGAQGSQATVGARVAVLEALGYGVDFKLPGYIGPAQQGAWAGLTHAVNTIYGARNVAPRDLLITKLAFGVPTAHTADDPFILAGYNDAGTTKLWDTGQLTGASTNVANGGLNNNTAGSQHKIVTLATPVAITAGTVFHHTFQRGGAGTTGQLSGSGGSTAVTFFFGTTLPYVAWWNITGQTFTTAAPTTINALTLTAASNSPMMGFRED